MSASIWTLGIRVFGAALQLGSVALVGFLFDLSALGLFGMLWSTATIFRVAGTFGLDLTGLKTQSVSWHRGEHALAQAYARRDTRVVFAVWAAIIAVSTGVLVTLRITMSISVEFMMILIFVAALSSVQKLWTNQMRAASKIQIAQILESLVLPALSILMTLVAAFFEGFSFYWGQLLAIFLVLGPFWYANPLRRKSSNENYNLERQDWGEALKLGLSTLLTALSVRLGIFFVGAHSLQAAGVYEVSQRVQSAASLSVSSVSTVFLPALRIESVDGSSKGLHRLILRGTALSMTLPGLLLFLHLLFGQRLIEHFLPSSMPGLWLTTLLLLFASTLNSSTSILSNLLSMTGGGSKFAIISIAQLALFIVGIVASNDYSAVSVALWVLVSEALRSLLIVYAAKWQLQNRRNTA